MLSASLRDEQMVMSSSSRHTNSLLFHLLVAVRTIKNTSTGWGILHDDIITEDDIYDGIDNAY
jgi:hypothetical protein